MRTATTRCAAMAAVLAGLISCQSNDQQQPPVNDPPREAGRNGAAVEKPPEAIDRPYEGPRMHVSAVQLTTHPPQHLVRIETTVPTGGWTLAVDEGKVVDGVERVSLTLERPARDEMVTQALVTLHAEHRSTEPADRVEVYVHLAQRGVDTLTTDYRLAATLGNR